MHTSLKVEIASESQESQYPSWEGLETHIGGWGWRCEPGTGLAFRKPYGYTAGAFVPALFGYVKVTHSYGANVMSVYLLQILARPLFSSSSFLVPILFSTPILNAPLLLRSF